MATKLDIANRALRDIGSQPIEAIGDDRSPTSRIVSDAIDKSIEEVLTAFPWTFSQRTEASTGTPGGLAGTGYGQTHDLSGLAETYDRLLSLRDSNGKELYEYHIEGQNLYSSEASVYIRYQAVLSDITTIPPYIEAAISAHLAKEVVLPITGNAEARIALKEEYEMAVARAKLAENKQAPFQAELDAETLAMFTQDQPQQRRR